MFFPAPGPPLPDSEQPEVVKRCQLVQQTPKPRRPFDRCPNSEAIVDRLTVQAECKAEILIEVTMTSDCSALNVNKSTIKFLYCGEREGKRS